uniref:FLYWCH-type domain-containing protein n=1 Tax=Panagrolaimus sp. PS1159 TaxID=55785 RepID=A0AC35FVC1_9BILA
MNSTLEKLLFPPSIKTEESNLEVKLEKEEDETRNEAESNESIVEIKQEIFDDKTISQSDQKLLSEIAHLLNGTNSTSSQSIKLEPNSVINENPIAGFGEPRIFTNERTTWELKPNQMYNPMHDNGTIRGRHLICENATYRNNGTKNNIIYWKCCFTNCKARLSTTVNGDTIIKYPGKHSHRLDGLDAQILDAKFQLRNATTSEELKQAVENIQANYPKYVQNKIKTGHISRLTIKKKPKLGKFIFDFDKFKADTKKVTK